VLAFGVAVEAAAGAGVDTGAAAGVAAVVVAAEVFEAAWDGVLSAAYHVSTP
jgi:hypothetical protein